jgi:hypothetical protein
MKLKFLFFAVLFAFYAVGCGSDEKDKPVPVSFLGHLDIVLDTASQRLLAEDQYMMVNFGMSFHDTVLMGNQRSFDMYLLGQQNFLHFSQAREFYMNQAGGVNLIFQSKKPEMKDSLMATWKRFTEFALDVNTSKGTGYTLYEILPILNWTNVINPRVVPFLSTYSFESYRTWGFADSLFTGIGMKSFMASWGGEELKMRLFDKIVEVHISSTSRELEILKSALFASGYTEEGTTYKLPGSATIFVTVDENENKPRLSSIKMSLSMILQEPYEKTYNRLKVSLGGNVGWLKYQ